MKESSLDSSTNRSKATSSAWPLASVCLFAWALATTYTNHAPLIPVFIEELGFSATEAGILTLAFFLCLAAASLPAGILSDRLGPKNICTFGLTIVFISNAGLGWAYSFEQFMLLKAIGGFGAGLGFIAGVRYVTVVFRTGRIFLAQGLYGGCIQLGAGTSLYVMPILFQSLNMSGAFFVSSGLIAITLVFWILVAPDRRVQLTSTSWSLAMGSRTVWVLTFAHTGTFGLAMLVGTWITAFLYQDLGLSLSTAGSLGSVVLISGILARPAGGFIIDQGWIASRTMIRVSLLSGTLGLALLALPDRPIWEALFGLILIGFAFSLPYSAVMNSATASFPESPGSAVGIVGGFSLILIALGAPAMGALYAQTANFQLAFGLLSVVSLLIFLLTCLIPQHEKLNM